MPNILLSNTATPQEETLAQTRAIASPAFAEIEFTITNRVITDIPNINFGIRIGQWVAATYSESGSFPSNGFFEFAGQAVVATTWYDCAWIGDGAGRIGKLQISFDVGAGTDCKVRLRLYFIAGFDINATFKNVFYNNTDHLLKDAQNSGNLLDNNSSSNDVYSVQKSFAISVWVKDTSDNSNSRQSYKFVNQLRFFNNDVLGSAPIYLSQTNYPDFLERPLATPVTTLSTQADTHVKLRFLEQPALAGCLNWHLNCEVYAYLIEINGTNSAQTFLQNYNLQYCEAQTGTTPLNPNYEIGNSGVWKAPFTSLVPLGGGFYECTLNIDKNFINTNKRYRIISVVRIFGTCLPLPTYDTGLVKFHDFSFISQEYICDSESTCLPIPTLVFDDNNISDYLKTYNSALRVSPGERLRSRVKVNFSNYDLDPNRDFSVATSGSYGLNYVHVKTYIESGSKKHVYGTWIANKSGAVFVSPPELQVAFVGNSVDVFFDFRARYESWFQNLQTEIGDVPYPPEITMNWIGKTVFVEFTFAILNKSTLTGEDIYDYIVVRQKVQVRDFDVEGSQGDLIPIFKKQDNTPLLYICEGDSKIKACFQTTSADGTENFIAMIDESPFGIDYLKEEESYVSGAGLSQMETPLLETVDEFFDNGTDTACCFINTKTFKAGEKKYLIGYRKRNI